MTTGSDRVQPPRMAAIHMAIQKKPDERTSASSARSADAMLLVRRTRNDIKPIYFLGQQPATIGDVDECGGPDKRSAPVRFLCRRDEPVRQKIKERFEGRPFADGYRTPANRPSAS
jgi:hypothetical protein